MLKLRILVIFQLLCVSLIAQQKFYAYTEVKQSLTGSPFNVEFRIENAEGKNFVAPDFGGLRLLGGPSHSMSTTIINGKMSSSTGYVYTLVGTKPGKYNIGSAKVNIGGNTYTTSPISIQIVQGQNNQNQFTQENTTSRSSKSNKEVFIKLISDKKELYVGQQAIITYKLFTQMGIDNIEALKNEFPNYCEFENIGGQFPTEQEVINGKQYITKIIEQDAIFPNTSGKLEFKPKAYRILITDPDPFGFSFKSLFFDNNSARVIETNELTLNVLPLPNPKPSNFSGAVGQYKINFSNILPEYNLSDAIKINLAIQGNGNFSHLDPKINLTDSLFESLKPNSDNPIKVSQSPFLIQSQNFEFLLSPKQVGHISFQPSFCYFDPEQKKYIQLKDSFNFNIKSKQISSLVQNVQLANIHTQLGSPSIPLFNQFWTYLLILLPGFLALIIKSNHPSSENKINIVQKLKQFFNSKFNKNEFDISNSSFEDLLFYKANILFPEVRHHNQIFLLKEFLQSSSKENIAAQQVLSLITEYQILKYNPASSENEFAQLKDRLKNI